MCSALAYQELGGTNVGFFCPTEETPAKVCVSAEHGDSKSAPKQDAAQQEASDNRTDNADGKSKQWHVVRAEAGPEVHVDKAAGIVHITGLPLGCRCVATGPP